MEWFEVFEEDHLHGKQPRDAYVKGGRLGGSKSSWPVHARLVELQVGRKSVGKEGSRSWVGTLA